MKQNYFLVMFAGAVLFCGCDKQAKLNGEKIEAVSQRLARLEQLQVMQMTNLQSGLTSLAPMLDKINGTYFEKSKEDAFFFHTNTLYLLLTVDRKIEAELQVADRERQAEHDLAYYYHTNETDTMYFILAQMQSALDAQAARIVQSVNAQSQASIQSLSNELVKQIKLSAPDEADLAWRRQLAADVAQIKRDLEALRNRPAATNPAPPPATP